MKKMRGSGLCKFIAWILFMESMTMAVLSIIVIMCNCDNGVYSGESISSITVNTFANINRRYSLNVWTQLEYSTDTPSKMYNKGFRYGIIETDDISDIDFNDKDSYLETNFFMGDSVQDIDKNSLYLYTITGSVENGYSSSYMGTYDYYRYDKNEDYQWVGIYADAVCYDEAGGIFYYRADGFYYPVQNVLFYFDNIAYSYTYDFYKEMYLFNDADYETDAVQYYDNDLDVDSIAYILENGQNDDGYITFNFLGDYNCSYDMWDILMDSVREINGTDLTKISSAKIQDSYFIKDTDYYLNENYTLMVGKDLNNKTYYIFSVIPENVSGYLYGNEYERNMWFVSLFDDIGLWAVFGLIICGLIAVLSLVFLVYAAGHRKDSDEIKLMPFPDKLPLDLWGIVVISVWGGLLGINLIYVDNFVSLVKAYQKTDNWEIVFICVISGIMAISAFTLWNILGFAVRIKNGKWWQNAICYKIIVFIKGTIIKLLDNIGLIWKFFLGLAAVSVMRLFILSVYGWDNGKIIIFDVLFIIIFAIAVVNIIIKFDELTKGSYKLAQGDLSHKVDTSKMHFEFKKHGENLNMISEGMSKAVEERIKSERFKTELITNVSHDIKTPLTSIINYVDLLEKEELHNEKAVEYLEVLERQSSKLKKLIEDLVEASKASSGNLAVNSERLDVGVFITQTVGEFEEKLSAAGLELIINKPEEPVYIMADGRHLWRVVDNLMNNICKYAQPQSRVYVSLEADKNVVITIKNISKYQLNVSGEELMERFVRGDRSRNTEGHGLGLSIAQSLVTLMKGEMNIVVDGDLFKVVIGFERM